MVILRTILVLFFLIPSISKADTIKIFLLQSYCLDHFCGSPQMLGLQEGLLPLKREGNTIEYRVFYMNTKTKNTTEQAMIATAELAVNSIKTFNPDFVVTFDDNAFNYVAIPYLLSKTRKEKFPGLKVIFSGLNKPFAEYQKKFDIDITRVGGVEELYSLSLLKNFLYTSVFSPSTVYVLYDSSPTSIFIYRDISNQLKENNIGKENATEIESVQQLKRTIIGLNKADMGLIISCLTRLENKETGELYSIVPIIKEIKKWNIKQLEIGVNVYDTRPDVGFAMAIGPDFKNMGKQAADILIAYYRSKKTSDLKIEVVKTILSVNTQRMSDLGLREYYKRSIKLFDIIDTSYE